MFGKVFLSVVCTFEIGGNALIIAQFARCKSLRTLGNLFTVNLGMADLCFTLSVTRILHILVAHGGLQGYGPGSCILHVIIIVTSGTASPISMGTIAGARYIAIVHPQKQRRGGSVAPSVGAYAVLLFRRRSGRLGWLPSNYHFTFD